MGFASSTAAMSWNNKDEDRSPRVSPPSVVVSSTVGPTGKTD